MANKRTIQENSTDEPGTFSGSFGWGFGFGWLAFMIGIIAMLISNASFPVYVLVALTGILIILNMVRLSIGSSNNSTYGKAAFFMMIVSIIDIIAAFFFRRGL